MTDRDTEEVIVDQLMDLFMAGTATVTSSTFHTFCWMVKKPEIALKLVKDVEDSVIKPWADSK